MTKKLREAFLAEQLPRFMGYFAGLIVENGGEFLCGSAITVADLALLHAVTYYSKGIGDFVPTDSLAPYSEVTAWVDRVLAHPKVAAYYAAKAK